VADPANIEKLIRDERQRATVTLSTVTKRRKSFGSGVKIARLRNSVRASGSTGVRRHDAQHSSISGAAPSLL
jgi:hypothetical protein